jgi:L-threonylcarbamoyladenylate synthase
MTKIIDKSNLYDASMCLKNGGTVVFPTETVYGLGADALKEESVDKIYTAKGRPSDNPLIIHIANKEDVKNIALVISEDAKKLIDAFWPGPLTMIFKKRPEINDKVTAGLDTVAVRCPVNEIARELIRQSGVYVAAPSANLSGSPSPTTLKHVVDDLNGRVDYIIDGTGCEIGIESTVLDVSQDEFKILRPGKITFEDIRKITDRIKNDYIDKKNVKTAQCPGMKYTHYSPKAKVIVVEGDTDKTKEYIQKKLNLKTELTGVISYKNSVFENSDYTVDFADMNEYASMLYECLRNFDENNIKTVYAQFKDENGIGVAVKNRIYKSAGYDVINL